MLKLIKYEFKKTMFSKYVLLAATLIAQAVFMFGVLQNADASEWSTGVAWGIAGLTLCAVIGMFFIGIESILAMHQDLNTKQSYMLFLTPHSTFEILGSKILQNGISLFLVGLFFGILAIADFSFMIVRVDGLETLLLIVNEMLKQIHMDIHITRTEGFLALFGGISSWLNMIVNGYFAIVLSATFFAGRKFSGIVSFLIYVVILTIESKLISFLPDMQTLGMTMAMNIAANLVIILVIYLLTGWIMEKKLNV